MERNYNLAMLCRAGLQFMIDIRAPWQDNCITRRLLHRTVQHSHLQALPAVQTLTLIRVWLPLLHLRSSIVVASRDWLTLTLVLSTRWKEQRNKRPATRALPLRTPPSNPPPKCMLNQVELVL